MRALLAITLSLWLGVACSGAPHASTPSAAADPAFTRAAAAAPAVFEGDIVAVGAAPAAWSGRYAVYQAITYRVTRVVTDPDHRLAVGTQVTVQHLLVAGSETADTRPRLRPALAHTGAAVIVLARWAGDRWTAVDEHHGLVVADAAHRAALTR
ncbi:MAG TPA: hypothetical protein VLM79_24680 [Kofleriaceae bacterium]|nr:hypothetical protein [Kofleriaceae bacterium]